MTLPLIKPPRLQQGDRIAAVSLSWGGPGAYPHRYQAGKKQLEDTFGVQVVESRHALAEPAWLARNPRARADDLMEAFADPGLRGIVSTIGGDDSIRLLPYLDLEVIRSHPKVFMGYSDTTVTQFACWKAGLAAFSGPTIMAGFAENGGLFPYMVESVKRTLFSSQSIGRIEPNREEWTVERLDWGDPRNQDRKRQRNPATGWRWLQGTGSVEGRLIGGCLEVLDWLRGSPVWPDAQEWQGDLLFIETSEEAPSPQAVTRMLRALAAAGVFQRIQGLLVGRPGGEIPAARFDDYDRAILGVVSGELGLTGLPVVTRMDFGHTDPMFVIPLGILARLDCDRQEFTILENAVCD